MHRNVGIFTNTATIKKRSQYELKTVPHDVTLPYKIISMNCPYTSGRIIKIEKVKIQSNKNLESVASSWETYNPVVNIEGISNK